MANERKDTDEDRAEAMLQALAHQLRRRIMRILLVEGEDVVSPKDASQRLLVPLSNVSYHFRVLAKSHVLELAEEDQVRGSVQHFYRASKAVAEMPLVAAVLAATSRGD